MTIQQQLLLAAFAAAFVFGVGAQASRFCLQGGLRELMTQGKAERLATYAVAVGMALLCVAAFFGSRPATAGTATVRRKATRARRRSAKPRHSRTKSKGGLAHGPGTRRHRGLLRHTVAA